MSNDERREGARRAPRPGDADLAAWSRMEAGEAGDYTNPDTTDWIVFRPDPSDVTNESIFDASRYVDAPSGKHGFLRATPDGKFAFEDGTPVRLLGGQANVFPEKDYAEWHVKWMRRYGLNLVRGHGFGLPDSERWDRLDYFINECKKAGIYVILTPIYWTKLKVVDPAGETVEVTTHVILFFNDNCEQAVRDLWKTFYHHKNPYTGLRYCDDPTIAGFELKNEDSAFWALNAPRDNAPQFYAEMLRKYCDFLRQKYGSDEALRDAWTDEGKSGSALADDESIEKGNIELLHMGGWADYKEPEQQYPRQRKSDQMEFLHRAQLAFYERSYAYLREIGCRQLICGSNWRGHAYTMRHVLECDSHLDYTDQHDYWDHPQGGWTTDVAVFHNKSMLRSARGGLVGTLAPRQVVGKPYIMTEWNIGTWNEHVQEASFSMISWGAMQGWSGLLQFVMMPENWSKGVSQLGNRFFDVGNNPSVALQYPTLARIWHRGDVRESEPVFIRRVCPDDLHIPGPIESRYFPPAFMTGGPEPEPEPDEFGYMLFAVGKVANEFVAERKPHLCRDDVADYLDQQGKLARSITGELTWDWRRGACVVNSPMTQGICGYVGGGRFETRDAVFEAATDYCVVLVTSLNDDRPIAESDRLLVTALGRSRNTGTVYGRPTEHGMEQKSGHRVSLPPEHQVAIIELGHEPIRTEPVTGTLRLKVADPSAATVHLLDHVGRRTGKVEAAVEGDSLVLPLPGEKRVYFYEITT